jgi:formiminoglutamate deiminase
VKRWCERAWLGDPTAPAHGGVVIAVDGDRITGVEVGVDAPPAGAERVPGLTVPGFANAHSHAFHRALRGRTHAGTGSFWTWREHMYDLAARLDPDRYRALATAAYAEMALAGFTCVGEFHYLHHGPDGGRYDDPNVMGEALIAAAADAGVRLTLLDTCYVHAEGVQLRFADADADAWAARSGSLAAGGAVLIGAAVHSVRAVDPAGVATVAAWADERGAPLHAHVSEQPAENEQCLAAHGRTPTELLTEHGAVGDRFTAVHGTHLTGSDIGLLATAGACCCVCPTTERDLADGIGPTAELRAANVAMCVGTDSHAVVDAFEEARAVELDERLRSLQRGTHAPAELLLMATANGYRSLGWSDGGRIEAGAVADLTTVGFDSVRLAGLDRDDPVAAVVFAAAAADVTQVMVGGEVVVRDGEHVRIDVAGSLARAIEDVWS